MSRRITDPNILEELFSYGNLTGADLSETNLIGINLIGADLTGADLRGTHLEGARLEDVVFRNSHLEGAHFEESHLGGAHFEESHLEGANFTGAHIDEDTNFEGAHVDEHTIFTLENLSREQIRQLGLQLAIPLQQVIPPRERPPSIVIEGRLKELCDIIKVFDSIEYDDIPATTFFENHSDDIPFIVINDRDDGVAYSGNALNWNTGNKEFVECSDDAPQTWQGNSYGRLVKQGGRRFIKVFVNGAGLLVLKPDWYDSKVVPGIRFFRLVESDPVFKYMSLDLATQNIAPDYSSLGADHCNQLNSQKSYYLNEVNLEQLNDMVPQGGGKKQTKRRKCRKGQTKRRKGQTKGRKGHTKSRKRHTKRRK